MRRRPAPFSLGTCVALAVAGLLLPATGAPAAAGPAVHGARPGVTRTALVTVTGAKPLRAPGVRVVSFLSGIGVEIVRGDSTALDRLRGLPGVAGLRFDGPVRTTGDSMTASQGVYAWDGLGAAGGRAGSGAGVTVAVVDTGISDTAALNRASGRLVDGVDTSPLVDGDDAITSGTFDDGFGHGTFLANLLAGGPLPGSSLALGVAPAARVVSVKVADDSGTTSLAAVLAGLDWVATHRPIDVVSLALAADAPGDAFGADPLTAAVEHLRAAGLTVVVSAGNRIGTLGDPGFDPQAITVGAADTTDSTPSVAPFSGSGVVQGVRKPDVVAAGVHVLGIVPDGSSIARTYPGAQRPDGLWTGSGTSEATAVAAGVAAIYLSGQPDAGPAQVKAMLRGAAAPIDAWRAGAGLLTVPTGTETPDLGEGKFDPQGWLDDQWDSPGWAAALADSWSTGTYTADGWSTDPWSGSGWGDTVWSAKSWSAKSWSAKSWSAKSWSAKSWSAKSWSASTFGAALPNGTS